MPAVNFSERLRTMSRHAKDTEADRASQISAGRVSKLSSLEKTGQVRKIKGWISDKDKRSFNCTYFIERLSNFEESDISFNEKLWISFVDYVTVPSDGKKSLMFQLRSGEDLTDNSG
ncbi:MAG TPA: hypothetical protein GXX72_08255 [Clostridiaceae bacterium]|nr:hypothetical protein [Clostridiaceae bacterium]